MTAPAAVRPPSSIWRRPNRHPRPSRPAAKTKELRKPPTLATPSRFSTGSSQRRKFPSAACLAARPLSDASFLALVAMTASIPRFQLPIQPGAVVATGTENGRKRLKTLKTGAEMAEAGRVSSARDEGVSCPAPGSGLVVAESRKGAAKPLKSLARETSCLGLEARPERRRRGVRRRLGRYQVAGFGAQAFENARAGQTARPAAPAPVRPIAPPASCRAGRPPL